MTNAQRKRRNIITTAVIAAVAGLSGGTYYYLTRGDTPVDIQTAVVTRGDVVDAVGASGTLEAVSTVLVGTQVTGRIEALGADFNSIVRKGQVLARLDPSLYEAQVEQARASVVRAEADVERLRVALADTQTKLQRARDLGARNLIPQTDLDAAEVNHRAAQAQIKSAEAQVVQARASLDQAELNLEKTVIVSPIDGIVISRDVDVGQTVSASTQAPTLFQLAADLTAMRVSASVDESDIGRVRPGQTARFRVDAFLEREFTGTVAQVRLQPIVDQNVVTYAVLVEVPNPELMLRPGMSANVTVEVARHDNVLRVANAALRFRPDAETWALLHQAAPAADSQTRDAASRRDPSLYVTSLQGTGRDGQDVGGTGGNGDPALEAGLASSVDQLFKPVEPTERAGRLWMTNDGRLTAVPAWLGLSDGVYTEVRAAGVNEGTEVVTSVQAVESGEATTGLGTSNPLLPQGGRRRW